MKLELKHLAPYLPYGIEIKTIENLTYWLFYSNGIRRMKDNMQSISINKVINAGLTFKPVLKPLSNINDGENNTPESISKCCYSYVEKLISEHYDIFGLIENGLAIDKKTLAST